MLSFLINIVEQLNLVKEHVAKGDANDARLRPMLINILSRVDTENDGANRIR
jgi:hypothetical protein